MGKRHDGDKAEFAKRLDKLLLGHPDAPIGRGRFKWLQEQLAERGINVTIEAISGWVDGRYMPYYRRMVVIADVFDVSVEELAEGNDVPKRDVSLRGYQKRQMFLVRAIEKMIEESNESSVKDIGKDALGRL
ncbi:helix-turn-helix transcriptional regulator [Alterisphingorhabdus coralli]|uniref:Helix-turn-helix transcriptional regulator n=1 Tax=Alterisphingorhabdus coralli TaxID=3071408 RepID=A0AA97FA47_9SPHN|nr:helix-turn-helix transcriptional regulator [Parasphingorhabdus sp. SCSIO 66989]WOE76371.1 helix-turn-helix transcriptional regulator [Parasphingorhabdus sp. SCSIO 66989]